MDEALLVILITSEEKQRLSSFDSESGLLLFLR